MNRRTHNRTPYWSQQYRRKARQREMDAILKRYFLPGIIDTLLGVPSRCEDFPPTSGEAFATMTRYGTLILPREPMRLTNITAH
jgi:hypothetical protein